MYGAEAKSEIRKNIAIIDEDIIENEKKGTPRESSEYENNQEESNVSESSNETLVKVDNVNDGNYAQAALLF